MPASLSQQRCWNHPTREAVCRCPACRRDFCRECVAEHEGRLLCASCLQAAARSAMPRNRGRRMAAPLAALAGLLLSAAIFFAAGELIMEFAARVQEQVWQQ